MPNPSEPGPVRMGVMGCADIAWRRTIPAIVSGAPTRLTAVASRDAQRAKRFTDRFGGAPVAGYDALLDRDDVDAAYIALPALMHAEWAGRALLAGKHVLVEKPMTGAWTDSHRLVGLARERGLVLLENYMFVHHSQHAAVRELVAAGAIGDVRAFSCAFTIPPKPVGDIRYRADVSGGPFLDMGGYPLRAATYFLGDLEISGAVFRRSAAHDVVMSGAVLAHTRGGAIAQMTFGMEHSYVNGYVLSGSTGRILLDRVFTPPPSYQPVLRVERQDHREERVLPPDDQFANVLAAFARAVRHGEDVSAAQDHSLRQARLIDDVRRRAVCVPC